MYLDIIQRLRDLNTHENIIQETRHLCNDICDRIMLSVKREP